MAGASREDAVATLEEGHLRIKQLVEGLSEEQMTSPATIGGGDWSAKDLLAHITIWEEEAIDTVADIRRGQEPRIERYFREGDAGVDRFNQESMAAVRQLSIGEVMERFDAALVTLTGIIRGMTDEEWEARVPYEGERRRTVGNLLGSITGAPKRPFGHAFAHIPDLEAYASSLKEQR